VIADQEHGETVCRDCGLVVEEDGIDHGPEWRAFDAGERDRKSRVGAPTSKTMHDDGLSTDIDWRNKDAYGRSLNGRQRRKMQRLRTWDERFRTTDSRDRSLKQAARQYNKLIQGRQDTRDDLYWNAWMRRLQINDRLNRQTDVIPRRVEQLRRTIDENLGGEPYQSTLEQLADKHRAGG